MHNITLFFLRQEQPPKKRFSTRVATFAKGLSPSGSFRRKQFKGARTFSLEETQQQPEKKAQVQVRIETVTHVLKKFQFQIFLYPGAKTI